MESSGNTSFDERGKFSYTNQSEPFKEYKIIKQNYMGDFGTGDVLAPVDGSGANRFYAMALSDVDSTTHCWYYSGNISSYSTEAPTGFGTGITDTGTLINAWENEQFGSKNGNPSCPDVWGLSTVKNKYDTKQWFVPSKEEWAAFGDRFDITVSNYSSQYGLSNWYWSSSLKGSTDAWDIHFDEGCIGWHSFTSDTSVRLSVTF